MKLELENIGKIKKAELDFNGLTVIVGDNNTGKSTIGKVLASLFTVMPDIDSLVWRARRNFVLADYGMRYGYRFRHALDDDFSRFFEDANLTVEVLQDSLLKVIRGSGRTLGLRHRLDQDVEPLSGAEQRVVTEAAKEIFERLQECRKIPYQKLVDAEIGKGVSRFFYGRPKTVGAPRGLMRLTVGGHVNEIVWDDAVHCTMGTPLSNRGWFIGSPLVINLLSSRFVDSARDPERMHEPLLQRMGELQEVNSVTRLVVQDKVRPLEERLERVLGGKIFYSEEEQELMIRGEDFPEGLPVASLSMGLKAFAVLRYMLEKGVLNERDVLVLDEPENHLHPQWQILYAEIIVMLQKCFSLTILLTTHSPYFLEAIELYAKKHGIGDAFSAYQPETDETGRTATILRPITNLAERYQKFMTPLNDLSALRGELEG